MLADLHCHYPMHLLAQKPRAVLRQTLRVQDRERWQDKLRAWVLLLVARALNFRHWSGTWRVSLHGLESGKVGVVLSVLYQPFDEIDLDKHYGAKPGPGYFKDLVEQLEDVERDLAKLDPDGELHVIVTRGADLEAAIDSGRMAFLHCVEGGFHLGDTPCLVREHVEELAGRGVAYITLAHLFWRQIATNAPAIPILSDKLYDDVFRQPEGEGLTELGRAAVEAMYTTGVLVDISHMRKEAIDETFALIEELDARHGADPTAFPVIASHAATRVGTQAYNLDDHTIDLIAARDGVIGLILAQHQLNDGIRHCPTRNIKQSMGVIGRHIKEIHRVTGSYDHVAIGSDLDGFIKPTIGGVQKAAELAKLHDALAAQYPADAENILSGNARRVLGRVGRSLPS